ncbi:4-hydroxy-3-methylbut-2-enyl diphosphate reductase [Massilia sp. CCM 8733]|uniref:4-hydroxy-3-methylbut-2-enyl diphosphate reductase n=1 Tax=Massilia mucilaginosa TaxID=2609282 RepID=A0ABX0NUW9_9BURK|nr:4-hydroxy-3-methylbut-2-enyl diphosphate reductase [Massilia mucilaginosa]NHZ90553.1 4-hydroxy-3-methylbut-2-enyl diphosphate reductase [Massilia mucilaginosa]
MQIVLANPRGFCAGVERAIEIVERALDVFGAPVYVRHEIVHNRHVVDSLRARGALFVEELAQVPEHSIVVFSAHGIAPRVRAEADARGLRVFDATCPLVGKVHMEVGRHARDGREVVLIGHAGHPEIVGTLGHYSGPNARAIHVVGNAEEAARLQVRDGTRLAYATQTTFSIDDIKPILHILQERFPALTGPRKEDICYATQNRQSAIKELAATCDLILVIGSPASANSQRLREIAAQQHVAAHLIDHADQLQRAWFEGRRRVGITSGASTPEVLLTQVVARLQEWGAGPVENRPGVREHVVFALPRELAGAVRSGT